MDDLGILNFVLFMTSIPFYIIGFIGNVLVIRIVYKTREMHTTTNYLLANLAVGDVITILMSPFYFSSHLFGYINGEFAGKFTCKFLVLTDMSVVVSALTLTLLAAERYHAILKPLRTDLLLNEDNIKRVIAFIWIVSVVLCFPELFLQEWSQTYSTCIGPWSLNANQAGKVFAIIFSVFSAYIPLVVFFYCYGSLIKGLYFTNTICPADTDEDRSDKKKLVVTIILATAGFVLGFVPIQVFYTIFPLSDYKQLDSKLQSKLQTILSFVFVCSLSFNPILYAFRSTNFQEGLKRIIFCRNSAPQNEIQL